MEWGAVFQGHSWGGRWVPDEASQCINCLELKAVYLGLQSFCQNLSQAHMTIFIDNTTAVAYINNMGGTHSLERNHIARRFGCGVLNAIFAFLLHICLDRKSNLAADKASRIFHDRTEWKLDPNIYFSLYTSIWGPIYWFVCFQAEFSDKALHSLAPWSWCICYWCLFC